MVTITFLGQIDDQSARSLSPFFAWLRQGNFPWKDDDESTHAYYFKNYRYKYFEPGRLISFGEMPFPKNNPVVLFHPWNGADEEEHHCMITLDTKTNLQWNTPSWIEGKVSRKIA
jgi:hypothetical protein|tara:strand:+ start:68 stop:412 length:345 start_codon:yes stop_codon:yes gene_type:complete